MSSVSTLVVDSTQPNQIQCDYIREIQRYVDNFDPKLDFPHTYIDPNANLICKSLENLWRKRVYVVCPDRQLVSEWDAIACKLCNSKYISKGWEHNNYRHVHMLNGSGYILQKRYFIFINILNLFVAIYVNVRQNQMVQNYLMILHINLLLHWN